MAGYTPGYGFWYPTSDEIPPSRAWAYDRQQTDLVLRMLGNVLIPKPGFPSSTDYQLSIGTGQEVLVAPGNAWVMTADGIILAGSDVQISVTPASASPLVGTAGGGTLNYLWTKDDGTIQVTQTSAGPTGLPLAGTALVTDTAITAVSPGSQRVNLDKRIFRTDFTWDPPSIANGAQANVSQSIPGAAIGDLALVSCSSALTAGMFFVTGHVTAADTVRVTLVNLSGGAVDLGSLNLTVTIIKY